MSDLLKAREAHAKAMEAFNKALENKSKLDSGAREELQKEFDKKLADAEQKMLAEQRKGAYHPDQDRDESRVNLDILMEKSDRGDVIEFQKWNDDMVILSSLLRKHPSTLKSFQKGMRKFKGNGTSEMAKAMSTGAAGIGLEWIPTDFSTDLFDQYHLQAKVADLFDEINMPSNPYKLPFEGEDPDTSLGSEYTTSNTGEIPNDDAGTGNNTMTAVKLTTRVNFSEELTEDSIIPVLPIIKKKMVRSMVFAVEDALLNGDTTAPHMDNDVTATTDPRKAWKGLRKLSQTANDTSLTAVPLITEIRAMLAKMGKYGSNPSDLVFICGSKGYQKLKGMAEVITQDKYGPKATIFDGKLASLDGIPIVVSEKFREDLNASGVHDLTTQNRSVLILAHRGSFLRGLRRQLTVKPWLDPRTDSQSLIQTWRGCFIPMRDVTAEPIVVKGYGWSV